jgi:hypothetical protein
MEYEGQHTEHDHVRAYFLHSRRGFQKRALIVGIICAVALVLHLQSARPNHWVTGLILLAAGYGFWYRYMYIPRWLRRTFNLNRELTKPFHTLVDEEGFETWHGRDQQKRSWADFRAWREDREYILLYEGDDRVYRTVPKRVFASNDDLEAFRELLKRRIGPVM